MTSSIGASSSTASPSTPACTGATASTVRRAVRQARPGPPALGRWPPEHHDAELAAVQPRPRALRERAIERVRVVRHEHHSRLAMLLAEVVDDAKLTSGAARTEHLGSRLEQGPHLRVAVVLPLDRVAVDPERHVVEEHPAVDLGHVDRSLDGVLPECIERADEIMPLDAEVEREVIAGPGRHARERKPVRQRDRGHDGERSIAAGHSEHVRATSDGFVGELSQVPIRIEDERVDSPLARPFDQARARCFSTAGPRVDEEDRPSRRIGGLPAEPRQSRHDRRHGSGGGRRGSGLAATRGRVRL